MLKNIRDRRSLYTKNRIFFILCIFSLFFQTFQAYPKDFSTLDNIKKTEVIKICSESGYMPLEMKTTGGKWIGFDVSMMEAYAKSLSVNLQMLDTKWDGIIPSLLTRKCDMIASSMAKTKERKKAVLFSDSYYNNNLLIGTLNSPQNLEKFKTVDDLNARQYIIAVKTGSSADLFLQNSKILNKAQILKFDADADTVTSVLQGRATAFIYDTPYVKLAALNYPGKIYILDTKLEGDEFGVAMRKEDKDLAKSFNSFLAQWKKNGEYEKQIAYFFESQAWKADLDK